MKTITVELETRSYPIYIGEGALSCFPEALATLDARGKLAVVSDTHVGPLYGERIADLAAEAGFDPVHCVMESGEAHKRLLQVETLCGSFLASGLDRASGVIALGGGVVGDTAGFAAATFMRGVPYLQIPTTIVAQVDSSVGGKTAVNHPLAKNIIGAFHHPSAVLIDTALLKTLPERELRAGLAEVIKHGVIADEALFAYMEQRVEAIMSLELKVLDYPIVRSCEIKAAIVGQDEYEHGVRANLNYGHTFGHGIEAASSYRRYLHGEAISLGMCAAGALARGLGLVDGAFVDRQRACLEGYGLPVGWPDIPLDATLEAMKHDKKVRAGTMKFVLADKVGHVIHRTDISQAQAREALESLAAT